MTSPAVQVTGVGKRYRRYRRGHPRTLKEQLLAGVRGIRSAESFWALRDVTFEVPPGRTMGLIGPNGAGKSTLLRLIAGVGRPDEGQIAVQGRVGALFEVGAGFHHELTGRESAIAAALVAGLTRREATRRLDDVVAFAELERFIDSPLRVYSSGMRARLAFAIAIHVDPDVLVVDEVLSVGDLAFQERCLDRIRRFQRDGVTLVVVSHDPDLLADLSHEVMWLRRGGIAAMGDAAHVTSTYREQMMSETRAATPRDVPPAVTPAGTSLEVLENRFGTQRARVESVHVRDPWGRPVTTGVPGDGIVLDVRVTVPSSVGSCYVAVSLARDDGLLCFETSHPWDPDDLGERGRLELTLARVDLAAGTYAFSVGIYSRDWEETHDYHWAAYPLELRGEPAPHRAVLSPPRSWSISTDRADAT